MKKIICTFIAFTMMMVTPVVTKAMEKGAFVAEVETSYANPDTGLTVDGGTNIALGDSMCASIMEDQVLIEQTEDKMYVTAGLGLMSNVSDVSMKVMNADGEFRDVELTLTGSCERDGDTCNHYRFEMNPEDKYFSPVIFVTPMGRNVQFFVKINYDSAQQGTGNFTSEMLQETSSEAEEITPEPEESVEEPAEPVEETKEPEAKPIKEPEVKSESNTAMWIGLGVSVVVLAGVAILIVKKKGK